LLALFRRGSFCLSSSQRRSRLPPSSVFLPPRLYRRGPDSPSLNANRLSIEPSRQHASLSYPSSPSFDFLSPFLPSRRPPFLPPHDLLSLPTPRRRPSILPPQIPPTRPDPAGANHPTREAHRRDVRRSKPGPRLPRLAARDGRQSEGCGGY
jgi:hypothetical protein